MAKGRKTGGRDFQKGNTAGKGRKPLMQEIRELRKATTEQVISLMSEMMNLTIKELEEVVLDPQSNSMRVYVANIIIKGAQYGETDKIGFLLDRVIGPVIKRSDVTSGDKEIKQGTVIYLPHNGREVKGD